MRLLFRSKEVGTKDAGKRRTAPFANHKGGLRGNESRGGQAAPAQPSARPKACLRKRGLRAAALAPTMAAMTDKQATDTLDAAALAHLQSWQGRKIGRASCRERV